MADLAGNGATFAWPVAVVAESPDDQSVVFRTYCTQWPVDGQRHLRPPILEAGDVHPGDVGHAASAKVNGGTNPWPYPIPLNCSRIGCRSSLICRCLPRGGQLQIEHYVDGRLRAADEHAPLSGRFNGVGAVTDIPRDERRLTGVADAGAA